MPRISRKFHRADHAPAIINAGRRRRFSLITDNSATTFVESTAPTPAERAARELYNAARALATKYNGKAIETYRQLIQEFQPSLELAVQEIVIRAYFNLGFRLHAVGRRDEALEAYNELLLPFRWMPDAVTRERAADAHVNRGRILQEADRPAAAAAAFHQALQTDPDHRLREEITEDIQICLDYLQTKELNQRLNSGLVSPGTVHDSGVPGEPTAPAQARGSAWAATHSATADAAGHEVTRPATAAGDLNVVAAELGVSFEDGKKALQRLAAEAKREATIRARSVDDARLLAGDLPASLRPRDQVQQPRTAPDEATIARADDVLAAYADGRRHGIEFSETEMMFVRASWRVKDAVKPKEPGKRRGRPKAHRTVMHS